MANPRFSIVIPTRQRHATLKYAIESCLAQEIEDYEVVVCDNYSSAETKQVVDEFASPHIRYVRAEQSLSMQDNWNLAYNSSMGDWVVFIGDDDGFMPFGLRQLDLALKRHPHVKAVRWNYATYTWPDIIIPEYANYLQLCLLRHETVLDSKATIKGVLSGRLNANQLPNLYHSAVSREILEKIKARAGVVFAGFHPDTYTSFAVAYFSQAHLSLTLPISIAGFSGASNNVAFSFARRKHEYADKHRNENAVHGLTMHPWVPDLPTLVSVLADSFLLAKHDLFPDDPGIVFDRKLFAERLLREMPIDDLSEWPEGVAEIRRTLEDDPALLPWFDVLAKKIVPKVLARDHLRPATMGYVNGVLHIDTKPCGVTEVAGAARLGGGILNYDRDDLPFDIKRLIAERERRWPKFAAGVKRRAAHLFGR
jgi:glycosyltransferase involved in cell wall biosynthesis